MRPRSIRVLLAGLMSLAAASASAQSSLPEALRRSGEAVLDALRRDDLPAIEARFSERMRAQLPHDRFVRTGAQIRQQIGVLASCGEPLVRRRDGITVVSYRCAFAVMPVTVTLGWSDDGELSGLFFVPIADAATLPLPPNVVEEALTTGAKGWPLPATLLKPASTRGAPIALLVHGSGPNDRDETIGPNQVFRDLSLGLAAHGIATLRYEKRTRALGQRFATELPDWTLDDEIVDDAVAALVQLAARDDRGPIFIVGHSEGAWLAPRIAARAKAAGVPITGIVMLASNLTPLAGVLVDQYMFGAALPVPTVTPAMVDDVKKKRDNVLRLVARGTPVGDEPLPLDMPASAWLDIGRYDPATALLAQPGLPALLTFGERDFQVRIAEKRLWEARLGGRPDTTIVAFAGLNHLLIEGEGPMSPLEYNKPGHVAPVLIDTVARWMAAQTHRDS
jgi:alpha-beta hydrolase superfamily lysophospholipase